MFMDGADNPFIPGTGNKPPHLVGRDNEKYEIETALARIRKKRDRDGSLDGVSPPLVLVGPRGVGKTVLLDWARRRAKFQKIHCAVLTENLLAGPADELGVAILIETDYSLAKTEIMALGQLGHPAETVIGMEGQVKFPTAVLSLRTLLNRKLENAPLLVILDEAHAVAPELLKRFCITTQGYVQESRPLALVMAGTPGLRGVLRRIKATFTERAEYLPLNLLTKEQARDALSVPATETGLPMDDDALEVLVE